MSDKSSIEWTEATWNPVRGCTKVSPGCKNCYAETFAERFRGVPGHPYEQGFDLRLVPEKLTEPLRWKKPRRVFVNSMSDLFQDGVPDSYIDQVFAVMASASRHTFQVLTKRPERMKAYMARVVAGGPAARDRYVAELRAYHETTLEGYQEGFSLPRPPTPELRFIYDSAAAQEQRGTAPMDRGFSGGEYHWRPWPLPNVWLGVSVENQHFADERIPSLLQTPAAVRFISAEPLLEHIRLRWNLVHDQGERLHWVIDGAESGHGARDYRIEWSVSLQRQCEAAGVAYFRKQVGHQPIASDLTHWRAPSQLLSDASGYRLTLKSKKGGDPSEWPEDLRVRNFPAVPA